MKRITADELIAGGRSPLSGSVSLHGDSGLETLLANAINDTLDDLEPAVVTRLGGRIVGVTVRYPEGGGAVRATAMLRDGSEVRFRLHYARPGFWEWEYPGRSD